MERKVNLRLRIILKALLAGAMRVTRSCSRAVDMRTSILRKGGLSKGYRRLRVEERDLLMTTAPRVHLGPSDLGQSTVYKVSMMLGCAGGLSL